MTYDELEKKYHAQGSALGQQRSANVKLKEYNARLKEKVELLQALLNTCCYFIDRYPQQINIADEGGDGEVLMQPDQFTKITRSLMRTKVS